MAYLFNSDENKTLLLKDQYSYLHICTDVLMLENLLHSHLGKDVLLWIIWFYELACKNNAVAIEAIMPCGIYFACLFWQVRFSFMIIFQGSRVNAL